MRNTTLKVIWTRNAVLVLLSLHAWYVFWFYVSLHLYKKENIHRLQMNIWMCWNISTFTMNLTIKITISMHINNNKTTTTEIRPKSEIKMEERRQQEKTTQRKWNAAYGQSEEWQKSSAFLSCINWTETIVRINNSLVFMIIIPYAITVINALELNSS